MKTALILMSAALLGAGAANAQTIEIESRPVERVQVADLNLASEAGLETLDRRIRGAAKRVCGIGGTSDLPIADGRRACFSSAVDDAMRQRDQVIANLSLAELKITARAPSY